MKYLWTTIQVKDMEESIAFYTGMAGLRVTKRFPAGPGAEIAFLGNGTGDETLVELMTGGKNSGDIGESISIGFAVDSMEEMLEKVKGKNLPVFSGPFETPGFRFFGIQDPNGLHVQFFQQK